MKKFLVLGILLFSLAGCAFFKQAGEDYHRGKVTPLAEGEISPQQKAAALATSASAIPYVNVAAPLVLLGGGFIFTWLRGRKLRKENLPMNEKPITGNFGKATGVEAVVQHLANVAAGLFEVGPSGSAIKRGWQVTLLAGLAAAIFPVVNDTIIQHVIANPPSWMPAIGVSVLSGISAAVVRWLAKVEPLKPKEIVPTV